MKLKYSYLHNIKAADGAADMGLKFNYIQKNEYHDSMYLMKVASEAGKLPGVINISAGMGTPLNLSVLEETGLLNEEGKGAGPNDTIVAVMAENEETAEAARKYILEKLSPDRQETWAGRGTSDGISICGVPYSAVTGFPLREIFRGGYGSIGLAARDTGGLNLAVISTPGAYAAQEAMEALHNGLNVFIFSDGVDVEDEVNLKKYAAEKGLLVMGPSCGLSFIGGTAVGLCGKVRRGGIGIAAASGSGMQEVMSIIHRAGGGISQAIGTGGRDLSGKVLASSMLTCIKYFSEDDETRVIVLISKPPSKAAADKVAEAIRNCGKPVVLCFIGGGRDLDETSGIFYRRTFEEAAYKALELAGGKKLTPGLQVSHIKERLKNKFSAESASGSGFLRAIYCGGTLAEEAGAVFEETLNELTGRSGRVYSNIVIPGADLLEDPLVSKGHSIIDIGDEFFTKGRPHAAIDPSVRLSRFEKEASDPGVAVIMMDFLLGYGMHGDPAGIMAGPVKGAVRKAAAEGRHLEVIAYICGTDLDPQGYEEQREKLAEAGAKIAGTNREAAVMAAVAIACYKDGVCPDENVNPCSYPETFPGSDPDSVSDDSLSKTSVSASEDVQGFMPDKTDSRADSGADRKADGKAGSTADSVADARMGSSPEHFNGILKGKIKAVCAGAGVFSEALRDQGVRVTDIKWRPPAYYAIPDRPSLAGSMHGISGTGRLAIRVEQANAETIKKMQASEPYWVGMAPAAECVPEVVHGMILHSGPPIEWERMCDTQKKGIINGILFENYAETPEEAEKLILNRSVRYMSANDYHIVAPGSGIATPSMVLNIVEDRKSGSRGYCAPFEGPNRGGLAGWGVFNENIRLHLKMVREIIAPAVTKVLEASGGMALRSLLARSVEMGDELHSRQDAAGLLAVNEIMRLLIASETDSLVLKKCSDLFYGTVRFFHPIDMAAAMAVHESIRNIPYSTVVTAMEGNGVEFGIKIAGTGNKWYKADSPLLEGNLVLAGSDAPEALPWIGDSCMLEAAGLGAFAAATSPAVLRAQGGSF
ncbi:MAG: DUF1116 domain-containing protein, partial [Eubacteriales bacterium]|nr:DUF1116 domain-containing protein [Eubacteriales bacterium]